ncbi:MAG: hypothetical protein AAB857_02925 [Patescibacteria group bacterium]
MIYILLIFIIVLIIILYRKLKKYIELEFIRQHNGILLETKKQVEEIYRDMAKSELTDEDLEPAPDFKE